MTLSEVLDWLYTERLFISTEHGTGFIYYGDNNNIKIAKGYDWNFITEVLWERDIVEIIFVDSHTTHIIVEGVESGENL